MRKPTTNIRSAAENAKNRLLAELKGKKGEDPKRQRRAANAIFNIIDKYTSGDLAREVERPTSVERNPQSAIERKVVKYWSATVHLMDWMFNFKTTLKEPDVIAAFDAIV